MNCGGLIKEVLEEKNFSMWSRDCYCNIAAFCLYLKNLAEVMLKTLGLIELVEEISKQPSIDSDLCLLLVTLMHIYNEKKQVEQRKTQNVHFEEKN